MKTNQPKETKKNKTSKYSLIGITKTELTLILLKNINKKLKIKLYQKITENKY